MNTETKIQPITQRFSLNDNIKNKLRSMKPNFGFNGLGELVFRRTYSRNNESWADVVIRVIEGCFSIRKEHYIRNTLFWSDEKWQDFAGKMAYSMFNMEFLPPGRGLWMMGTEFAYTRGSFCLNNCSATDTRDDLVHSCSWSMDCLMNGVGVGFSTYWRGEAEKPDKNDSELFVIPDSREGWVESLIKLLCSYIDSPKYGKNKFPVFDYSLIRQKGEPIRGFGGKASGPKPLRKMHERITGYLDAFCDRRLQTESKVWKEFKKDDHTSEWKQVTVNVDKEYNHTRLIADIFNAIGACVVAGNVRRCLPKNSMVHTRKGLVSIQNVNVGDEVLTFSGYEKVLNKFIQGEQKLVKILTKDGFFRCTSNHRMAVYAGPNKYVWKTAEELTPNDFLITSNKCVEGEETDLPEFNQRCEEENCLNRGEIQVPYLDEDIAWLIGFIQKNGIIEYGSFLLICCTNDQLDQVVNTLERFGRNLNIKYSRVLNQDCYKVKCDSKILVNYFSKFIKNNNENIEIPEFILRGYSEIRYCYIQGVLGSLAYLEYPDKFTDEVSSIITVDSQKYAQDLQNLCYSCGIQSRYKENKQSYQIEILEENNIQKYSTVQVLDVIEDITEETFDIEVSNNHEFYCNGYLTHNSAEISLGDVEDSTFLNLKNYELNPERSEIGWMSNNSVVLSSDKKYEDFSYIPDMARRIRDNGEPGMINLHNIQKYGRMGNEMPDKASLTNPCFSGDTLIAVADGRDCVSIRELAESGEDVPVYSMNKETGEISIQWGRRPRITGEDKKLLRIHFSYPHKKEYLDVTPNHKFFLNDGRELKACELKKGDSLPAFSKNTSNTDNYTRVKLGPKKFKVEHRMIAEFYEKQKFYENHEEGLYNGFCKTNGVVVHHIDENKLNNSPNNLEITTAGDHNRIHNQEYVGEGNPMYGKKHSEETKKLIGEKARERCEDPEYRKMLSEAQTPELREQNSIRMKKMRNEKQKEWCDNKVAENIEFKNGLRIKRISDTKIQVIRICENPDCRLEFLSSWNKREQAFCSTSCANTKKSSIEKRNAGQKKSFEKKAKENFHKQVMIYKDLQKNTEGKVMKKDWEKACKVQKVSYRFNRKTKNPWIAPGWREFKQLADDYNHQVSHVEELDGSHTVYNITVDNNHTLAVVTKSAKNGKHLNGVFNFQCGEISLENFELCNLAETFPPRCKNYEVFCRALEYATFYSSTVSLLPTHRPETNSVIARNRRIGISISGIAQWASGVVPEEWGEMNYTKMGHYLREAYDIVRRKNTELAEEAGVPRSIRVTTVKPSGSISLLAGVTPGVHYPVSRYVIRRVRIGATSPLIAPLKEAGVPWEKDKYSDNTLVFEFVVDHGNVRPCEEVSPWEQFSLVQMMQRHYSDNSVSATIYFDKEKDGNDIEKMLAMFIPNLKSVSLLPHSGHGYEQAPYEPIEEKEYLRRLEQFNYPDYSTVRGNVPTGSRYCTGDKCVINIGVKQPDEMEDENKE